MTARGFLSDRPQLRGVASALLGAAAILAISQWILPGTSRGEGTPAAIVFHGLIIGALNGLVAAGIILIYRTARIINFSQAALGAAGGVMTYNILVLNEWNYFIALALGLITAAVLAIVFELGLVRRFYAAPRLVLTVLTIAFGPLLGFFAEFVTSLPLFPEGSDRTIAERLGTQPFKLPFPGFSFQIGDLPLEFGFGHLFAIGMAALALAGLGWFLKFTRLGTAVRASAENAERAELLGVPVRVLSTLVWGIAGVLSGLGVILAMTINQSIPPTGVAVGTLIPALAAAVLARLKSLPVGVGAAIGITIIQSGVTWSFEEHLAVLNVAFLAIILVSLFTQREEIQRSEEREATSWEATMEIRPTPKEMLAVPGVRIWRWVMVGLGLVAAFVVFPLGATVGQLNAAGFVAIMGIVLLSLVVLTGWSLQFSLGQIALVGVAAVIGGAVTQRWGINFWVAIPLVTIFTSGFAALIGLPALRVKGLYLGVATLAFALVVSGMLFEDRYFGWMLTDRVDRPTLFFFDFEDERSMYFLAVAALVVAALVTASLRRSRTGRVMIALRDNEANVQSFGINAVRTRISAFALSGALCGLAGILLAVHQRAVTQESFQVEDSLNIFLAAVVGGTGSVSGALLGAAYLAVTQLVSGVELVRFFEQGGAVLILAYIAPGGLSQIVFGLRDAALRIVAQRRRMVVPALFADYDPEALERQIGPLASPSAHAGLAALPFNQRYSTASELYRWRTRKAGDGRKRPRREADAMTAAAGALEERSESPGGSAT